MSTTVKPVEDLDPDNTPHPPVSSIVPSAKPAAGAAHRGRDYADLEGGQGREVYFRPHRYQREDLGPVSPVVRVSLQAGAEPETLDAEASVASVQDCALRDISQNGVAFEWPAGAPVEVGQVIAELMVSFDGHEAYAGHGRVRSVREVAGRIVVGASFTDSLMNIHDVLHLRDVRAWNLSGSVGLGLRERPWQVNACERFKSLVGDLHLLLDDASKLLARLESSLPWSVAHGDQSSPARGALIQRIREEFVDEFVRYSEEIDVALRATPESSRDALKEYSRRHLQEYLLQAPCMHRALYKPLGYPGDYEIMKCMYEAPFAGPTLFAKSMSLAIMSTRPAEAVRARKDMVKRELSALLDLRGPDDSVRVLSIAAGPAQEVFELLRERTTVTPHLEIVLFDQDEGALTYAYARLKTLVDSRWPGRVRIVFLHDSIKRLLKDPAIFHSLPLFDVIFCCGLFDYLELPTAVVLCRTLFARLLGRGTLYVGNMVPSNPNRWFMELHLDWFLIYRSELEMLDVARRAAPGASTSIMAERTGINPFVVLRKD